MSFDVASFILASAVAVDGTVTVSYPANRSRGNYLGSTGHHVMFIDGNKYEAPADFTLTFNANASNITLTNKSAGAWAAAATCRLQMERRGERDGRPVDPANVVNMQAAGLFCIDLGSPATADIDFFIDGATSTEVPNTETVSYTPDTQGTSPTDAAAPVVTKNGVKYWELAVPRNITTTVTHGSSVVAMTIRVTGLDEYEQTMSEDIAVAATGTTQSDASLKAFKWVRTIALIAATNAEANTVEVGFGDVLGLPVFVPNVAYVVKEIQDAAVASAGTFVGGVLIEGTSTSGDVRGTYDPSAACDADKGFVLIVALPDPANKGIAQFAG